MEELRKTQGNWRSLPLLLALFYIVLMTPLMGRKNGYTVDATPSFQLTRTILTTGEWFPPNLPVKQGYIYSVVYIPFYIMGDALSALFPGVDADWIHRKCLCWMNTVVTGLTVGILSLVIRRMKYSKTAQIAIPLLFGFSTMAFNYARYDYNKCLAGLGLLLAFYYAIRFVERGGMKFILACGAVLGFLAALRLELLIATPVLLWGILRSQESSRERYISGATFLIPCLLGIAWVLFYNYRYWGGEASGGYEEGFQANPMPGLIGFLFSPGKNLWVFNPVLLLLPLSLRTFREQQKALFPLWLGIVLTVFGLYCFWGNWWGGWGWGPRHLVPLLPLLILPLAVVVDSGNPSYRTLLAILALAGIGAQCLGAAVDFNDVIMALTRSQVTEPELIWNPVWNALLQHGILLGYRPFSLWDIGWIGLKNTLPGAVFWSMLILWTGTLTGLAWAAIRLHDVGDTPVKPMS